MTYLADECTKNITVNQKLKDRVQPELFSRLGSTNIGDPYKDKYKEKQLYELDKNNLNPHGRSFVPSNNGKKMYALTHSVNTQSISIWLSTLTKAMIPGMGREM